MEDCRNLDHISFLLFRKQATYFLIFWYNQPIFKSSLKLKEQKKKRELARGKNRRRVVVLKRFDLGYSIKMYLRMQWSAETGPAAALQLQEAASTSWKWQCCCPPGLAFSVLLAGLWQMRRAREGWLFPLVATASFLICFSPHLVSSHNWEIMAK